MQEHYPSAHRSPEGRCTWQRCWANTVYVPSLIQPDLTGRYQIHKLLRQFGAEKLAEAGELAQTRSRHLTFFLKLAEDAEPHLENLEHVIWLNRLEAEHDNLRAALGWSRTAEGAA